MRFKFYPVKIYVKTAKKAIAKQFYKFCFTMTFHFFAFSALA